MISSTASLMNKPWTYSDTLRYIEWQDWYFDVRLGMVEFLFITTPTFIGWIALVGWTAMRNAREAIGRGDYETLDERRERLKAQSIIDMSIAFSDNDAEAAIEVLATPGERQA